MILEQCSKLTSACSKRNVLVIWDERNFRLDKVGGV